MSRLQENPDAKALRRLIMASGGPVALLRQLQALSAEDRARLEVVFTEHRDDIIRRLRSSEFKAELAVLMVELGVSPRQVAETVDAWFRGFIDDGDTLDALGEALIGRGPEWGQRLVDSYLGSASSLAWVSLLLDPIIVTHQLPLPSDVRYLSDWLQRQGAPAPGRRWQEHFLAVCSHPDAMGTPMGPRAKVLQTLRYGTPILRDAEPLDDVALANALLGIIERGDRPQAQSNATLWLEGLGLVEEVWIQRERLLTALPNAHSSVVAFACTQLLRPDLDDDQLATLAVEVLARKEKGAKKQLLKHLGRLATPGPDLVAALQGLARGTDPTLAAAAMAQLSAWEVPPEPEDEPSGLWQEPAGEIEVLAWQPRVLDDPGLAELITVVTTDSRSSADFEEQLAELVATAHSRGLADVLAVLERFDLRPLGHEYLDRPALVEALVHLVGDRELPVPRTRQQTRLVLGHALAITARLGELPCLLSTPTHHGNHLAWRALLQRASRYRDLGLELEPTDVLAALNRVDPDAAPSDLTALEQPIRGVERTLAEVIRIWQRRPHQPRLEVLPPNGTGHRDGGPHMRCKLNDDKPSLVVALGLLGLWNAPDEGYHAERTEALRMLPAWPHRTALRIIKMTHRMGVGAVLDDLWEVGQVANPFAPVLSLACLVVASESTPTQREQVASVLFTAWQEGRLHPQELLDAWRSPEGREFQLSPTKIVALLRLLAEAGGLVLVWPLLVVIAEELAAEEKIPATAGAVFETLLVLLPEVPHQVELPNITALATRKGSSKAITLARAITEKL